jgi:hypothetical protein
VFGSTARATIGVITVLARSAYPHSRVWISKPVTVRAQQVNRWRG